MNDIALIVLCTSIVSSLLTLLGVYLIDNVYFFRGKVPIPYQLDKETNTNNKPLKGSGVGYVVPSEKTVASDLAFLKEQIKVEEKLTNAETRKLYADSRYALDNLITSLAKLKENNDYEYKHFLENTEKNLGCKIEFKEVSDHE